MVAGKQAAYTVTVSNIGDATAKNVVVTDTLPVGVIFDSSSPAADDVTAQVLTFNLGDMTPGAEEVITIYVIVDATDGELTNTASATTDSTEGGQGDGNNSDSCASTVLSADVAIDTLCRPSTVVASSTYCFVVNFSNNGTADAEAVVVTDYVPAGFFKGDAFTPTSTVGTVTVDGLTVTVDVGTLAPGASGVLEICGTASDSASAAGEYTNSASVQTTSKQSDTSNDNDSCNVNLLAPDLTLDKTSVTEPVSQDFTNTAQVGANEIKEKAEDSVTDSAVTSTKLTYTLVVTNTGTADATGVILVDTLPAGVTVVENPNGGNVVGNTITWDLGTILADGGNAQVTVTVETN
jgi:uncharacterized repeat protein (TIGR01451 family)